MDRQKLHNIVFDDVSYHHLSGSIIKLYFHCCNKMFCLLVRIPLIGLIKYFLREVIIYPSKGQALFEML